MRQLHVILALTTLTVTAAHAQATDLSVPAPNYLLAITQRWGSTSALGDMVHEKRDSTDVEVRLWGGYGLTGTAGVILRRRHGRWSTQLADVQQCDMPISADDSITDAGRSRLEQQARRHCPTDVAEGTFTSVYWLRLHHVSLASKPSDTWSQLLQAGVLTVPPEPHAKWIMLDGFTYVLEVRVGDTYRASVLPQLESSVTEPDSIVQQIARILGFGRSGLR